MASMALTRSDTSDSAIAVTLLQPQGSGMHEKPLEPDQDPGIHESHLDHSKIPVHAKAIRITAGSGARRPFESQDPSVSTEHYWKPLALEL